jgi:hypothetical protein
MNDKQNNNQNDSTESVSSTQVDTCQKCKKDPCVCSNKSDDSSFDVNQPRTEPPKVCWI